MLVRQLAGRYAGDVVDLPYHVAMQCIRQGTAINPADEAVLHKPKVMAQAHFSGGKPPAQSPTPKRGRKGKRLNLR